VGEAAADTDPDVVLIDVRLPGRGGAVPLATARTAG
jgi:CheY-like chemotaxis protein